MRKTEKLSKIEALKLLSDREQAYMTAAEKK